MGAADPFALVDRALAGTGSAVVVEGGPGAGKSWTLERVVSHARSSGLRTSRIRFDARQQRAASAALNDRLPGGFLDVRDPALIAVDDLHWADTSSLSDFAELCRQALDQPLVVVATLRPWPDDAVRECAELVRRGDVVMHHLKPMKPVDALTLLGSQASGNVDPATAELVIALCGGNPRLICAVTASLSAAEAVPTGEQDVVALISHSPGGVAGLLGLPITARRFLEAACVLGERFRPELAVDIAGGGEAGYEALDCLCRLGVLRQGPGRTLEFAQPLVERVMYQELTPAARVRLHARAFEALSIRGFERRASAHASLGNLSGSRKAIKVLARVGHAALRDGAPDRAAGSFRAALELSSDRATPELRMALADALLRAGRPAGVVEVLDRLLREVDVDARSRLDALRLLARALAATGRRRAAETRLREAATLSTRPDRQRELELLTERALILLRLGRPADARALVNAAPSAQSGGQSVAEDLALCDSVLRAFAAEPGALEAIEPRALELLHRSHDSSGADTRVIDMATAAVVVLAAAGRLMVTGAFVETAIHQLQGHGVEGAAGALLAQQALTSARIGRLDVAAEQAAVAVAAVTHVPGERALALAIHAYVLLHLDRIDDSRAVCNQAGQELARHEDALAALWFRTVEAQLALVEGDAVEAARLHELIAEQSAQTGLLLPGISGWESAAIVSLVGAGHLTTARALVERLETAGELLPHAWAKSVAAAGRGLLAGAEGNTAVAAEKLREAVALSAEIGALDRIAVRLLLGTFLRRSGQGVEARRVLDDAGKISAAAGAVMLGRLAATELRIAGARGRTRAEPGKLTPQEARVVELAASGRSNKEIARELWITVNTVETHMQRAFAKLGVTTRIQLVARQTAQENESIPV